MPFKSKSQQRFLYARHPEIAEEFSAKTKSFKSLPEKVSRRKAVKKALKKGDK